MTYHECINNDQPGPEQHQDETTAKQNHIQPMGNSLSGEIGDSTNQDATGMMTKDPPLKLCC